MLTNKKWHVLLCAIALIAAVVLTVCVVSSCSCGSETATTTAATTTSATGSNGNGETAAPDDTGVIPGTTNKPGSSETGTPITTAGNPVVIPPEDLGAYNRVDTNGTQLPTATTAGVVGDFSSYTSISGVVTLGDNLFVSDETGKAVYKLSLLGEVQKKYTSTRQINNLVTDGTDVYALEGGLDGTVVKLTADLTVSASVSVGHTPSDMAIVGGKGYVANRFTGTVSVITLSDMKVSTTITAEGREPIAAVAVGTDVYVACHLPDEATTANVMSANVMIISTANDTVTKTLPLVNGASGVKDICVAPDGKTVYVSHIIGRYAYPTTQLDRGWINTNGFSVINAETQTVTCAVLLDEVDEGAANPWGITVSSDGKYLCVALSGLNEVMIVNISKMNTKINAVAKGSSTALVDSLADIVDYLPFLNNCRERVTVGVGVRSITEKNGILYCGLYFDGGVDAIKLSDLTIKKLNFVTQPEASVVRQGQILWSDANNCYQKWESCNSCHPDAIVDGFNWDNLNDGLGGGGKSAKSMLYAHRTPPVMITGIRPNAEAAVAAGMKFIQFNTMSSYNLNKIDEYLKSLAPLQSPALNKDGTLTESATAGKALFEKNCASCHPAPLYTDMKTHDVGTKHYDGDTGLYDTPTLVEVWRTGPYMHDGSLYTLEEVVKYFAKDLNDTEVKQLADFVRSICAEGEDYGVEQVYSGTKYNLYTEGASIDRIVVRKQALDAAESVVVALNVYDKDGKQIYYADALVTGLAYNSTAVITIGDPTISAIQTLPGAVSYTVSFYDYATGNPVATTFTVK